ncbi:archease [Actinoallomurus sp. NBC_01490]|uniref:archease n=1 Tax=Actinoallomurus sp. NBC_01490 TaxID=2903557 RepID=UPI002E348CCD|nr:archease [Actinoallomurus sp. NBC_01490]
MTREESAGHRIVPHTADLRIEAWAPTREQCIAEAVYAMVGAFTDLTSTVPAVRREFVVPAAPAQDQLVTVLNELIYRMDTDDEVPRAVEVRRKGADLQVLLAMADTARVTVIGAAPKAVTRRRLSFGPIDTGWRCIVTLDA